MCVIYPSEVKIKYMIDNACSASYLDRFTSSCMACVVTIPFLSSNFPILPAYDAITSQLVSYTKAYSVIDTFFIIWQLPTSKLLS